MPQFPSRESASGIWTLKKQKRAQQGSNWPLRSLGDFLWNYVTALFKTTPTNGAQNNTFLDSSTNNFTITRNGNTTQGTFTPYGSNWSNYFDGSGDYLYLDAAAPLNLQSGNFTIEMWAYRTVGGVVQTLISNYESVSAGYSLVIESDNKLVVNLSGDARDIIGTTNVPVNQWFHVALSGTPSGSVKLFLNGVQEGSTYTGATSLDSTRRTAIGAFWWFSNGVIYDLFTGYISNLRIVKGTALYTSNFTPSTSPLTAISGTSLLTCQSNRFIDNSSNNFTFTINGDVSVQRIGPFVSNAAYSAATIGGSGYFDGSGDYLTVPQNSALAFGTGDFTVEFWVNVRTYRTSVGGYYDCFLALGNYVDSPYFRITPTGVAETGLVANALTGTTVFKTNTWYHYAVTRSGTTARLFINGVLEATVTNSSNLLNGTAAYIGTSQWNIANETMTGFLSNLRIVKGSALYTASFTPPTAPVTAVANTSLLLNFTNAGIYDSSIINDIETAGNAQVSTTQARFGTTSMYFDGSGDYLLVPASPNLAHGTNNFTLEMWVNTSTTSISNSASRTMWGTSSASYQGQLYLEVGTGKVVFGNTGSTFLKGSSNVADGNWHHIAVSRHGTSCLLFVDGRREASGTNSVNYDAQPAYVGAFGPSDGFFNGYIDDLRITKGYARYWYPFTPPAVTLGDYYEPEVIPSNDPLFDYTTLLLSGNGTNGAQNNTFLDSSTNNFSITRNGNTTQGSFSPFGSNWSNSFNGNGDWLTTNLDATTGQYLAFGSTQDFTIELFFNQVGDSVQSPDASNARNTTLISTTQQDQNFPLTGWDLGINPSSTSIGFSNNNNENSGTGFGASIEVTRNIWHHVAVVRSGGTMTLYLDGAAVATSSAFNNRAITVAASAFLRIGTFRFRGYYNDFNGYISNVRIVKGTAVYSGTTYTVPTSPLTAISGTVLLACQNNRFRDNSSSAYNLSTNGTPSVQRFSPFNPTTPYAAGTIGGSGYFDGTGDYLTAPSNAATSLDGDFTIEYWIYRPSGGSTSIFTLGDSFTSSGIETYIGSSGTAFLLFSGNTTRISSGTLPAVGAWSHVAVVRSGTTVTLYLNGASLGTWTSSATFSGVSYIGAEFYNGSVTGTLTGYLSNLRITKGTAVYTTAFTPPTSPVTGGALLLNFTNGGIIDNAMMNDLETVGNAQISTSVSKFGGGSLAFDGSGDYLFGPANQNAALGTGDFTLEAWVYVTTFSTTTGFQAIFSNRNSNSAQASFDFGIRNSDRYLYFYNRNTDASTFSTSGISGTNTWTHVAIVRVGSTITFYINGTSAGTVSVSTNSFGSSNVIYVGTNFNTTPDIYNGYIDDLRITRGIARYVQPFTPPTQAFQTQ